MQQIKVLYIAQHTVLLSLSLAAWDTTLQQCSNQNMQQSIIRKD